MRRAAAASRHGTAVSRASRAVLLLLGVTAAVWCTSVLLAAPAEADDGGLDLGGLGDTVAAVHGGVADAVGPARSRGEDAGTATQPRPRVTDAVRPVVERAVEPVVRHAVRPVVRRVGPAADARATDDPAPAPTAVETALPRTRAALGDATEQLSGLSGQLGPVRPRTADAPRASAAPTLPVAVVGTVGAAATAEVPALLDDVVEQVLAPVRDLTAGLLATFPGTVEALAATVSSLVPAPDALTGLPLLVDPLIEPGTPQTAPGRPDRATQQPPASHGAAPASVVTGTDAPERAQRDVTPSAAPDAPTPSTPYDAALPDAAASSGGGAGVPLLAPACRLDAWALPVADTDSAVRGHRTATTTRPSGRPACTPD